MTFKLGFLGPCGTFSEEAALIYSRTRGRQLRECTTITEVMEGVANGALEEGIVPLENSLEGSIAVTLDLLAGKDGIFIREEIVCPVRQCLLASTGASLDRIKRVYSHPHGLGQCRGFLERKLPAAELCPMESTAAAARLVSGKADSAAVAPRRAAAMFNLQVLVENIEDNGENATRFVIVARRDHPPTGKDKTSLVLAIPDGPGSLYHILGYFARRKVNLTRIESRPARRSLGDWLFFIDCEGHRSDPELVRLWKELEPEVASFKLLGSYPRYEK